MFRPSYRQIFRPNCRNIFIPNSRPNFRRNSRHIFRPNLYTKFSGQFAPIVSHSDNFEDAHNSAKKKNVWKKTVGKSATQKNVIIGYTDKIASFVKKQYKSYVKNITIEKIIATQIGAVGNGFFDFTKKFHFYI